MSATAQVVTVAPWLQEFSDSAIALSVAQANAYYLEGAEAVEELLADTIAARQKVHSYVTAGNAATLRLYQCIEDGAWFANPALPSSPYCKPNNPRPDTKKHGKFVKYDGAPGAAPLPLFPHLGAAVKARWGVDTWAEVLTRPDIIVVFTEGWKKALALVSQGIPAICVRGITQWHPGGDRELWPELAQVVATGRSVAIAFDQDIKTKTRADVARQTRLLGNAIERAGGKPRFMVWDSSQGKGIDDALAALPPEQQRQWLDQVIQQALTPADYRRVATIETARAIINRKGPAATRETTGEYLPTLPTLTIGAIHWLDANMGSGKTYRMGRDWVRPWIDAGGIVVVDSPLNSLGQQTSKDWDIPHIHDYHTDPTSQEALKVDINQRGGVIGCFNNPRLMSLIPSDRPVLLIFDEGAQVFTDAAEGGTLQSEWADRWEDAIALMQRAASTGAIALAEAGIDADTINLVKTLSGATQSIGIRHSRESAPWLVQLHRATPLSGWRSDLLARLAEGDRILYVTTSQAEGRRLEQAALAMSIVTHRIDSTTNEGGRYREVFEAPEPWLYQTMPQLLILSPSAKTGLSIEGGITVEGAYFDSVWGYFPSLDTDTAMQLLGRYRPAVPRHVWAPAFIQPSPGEGPGKGGILDEMATTAANYARHGNFEQAPADATDSAIKQYLASRRTRRWAQKVRAADALAEALVAAGHNVDVIRTGSGSKEVAALWAEIKESLAREDSAYHAALDVAEVPGALPEKLAWAIQVERGTDSTHDDRCMAAKIRMMARFLGIDWNNPDVWYGGVFCPSHGPSSDRPSSGPVAKGAARWSEAEHWQSLWAGDVKAAQTILGKRLRAAHLLPTQGVGAMLAAQFKPLIERLLSAGKVSPTGDTEAQIKTLALKLRSELRQFWRLEVAEDQSTTAIANKIARKFGLILARLKKVNAFGQRLWSYSIEASDLWRDMAAARAQALGTNSLGESLTDLSQLAPRSRGKRKKKRAELPKPQPIAIPTDGQAGRKPVQIPLKWA